MTRIKSKKQIQKKKSSLILFIDLDLDFFDLGFDLIF